MDSANPYGVTHLNDMDLLFRVIDKTNVSIYNFSKKKFIGIKVHNEWLTRRVQKLSEDKFKDILEKETIFRELSK